MCFFFFLNFFPLSIVLITHTWNWPCVLWFSFHLTLLVLLSHCFTPVQHETHFQQHFSISVSLSLACFYLSLSLSLVLQRTRAKANTLSDNNEKHWYRWDEEMLLFFFSYCWCRARCERAPATHNKHTKMLDASFLLWTDCFATHSFSHHIVSIRDCMKCVVYFVVFFFVLPQFRDRFTQFFFCRWVPNITRDYPLLTNKILSKVEQKSFFSRDFLLEKGS